MCSGLVVVRDEQLEPAAQISLTEYDYVVEAFPSNGSDDSFDVCSLPRRLRCRQYLLDAHGFDLLYKLTTEDAVAVSKQIGRSAVPRKCFVVAVPSIPQWDLP